MVNTANILGSGWLVIINCNITSVICKMRCHTKPFHPSDLWVYIVNCSIFLCHHSTYFSENTEIS